MVISDYSPLTTPPPDLVCFSAHPVAQVRLTSGDSTKRILLPFGFCLSLDNRRHWPEIGVAEEVRRGSKRREL